MYTSLNSGHKVFYANDVCVFIDIDQLKGKPMQKCSQKYTMWFKDLYVVLSIFTNGFDYSTLCITVIRYVQCSLHTVHVNYDNGTWHANLSSMLNTMLG